MQGEVVLQLHIHAQATPGGLTRDDLDDLAVEQSAEELPGPFAQRAFLCRRLMAIVDQLAHGAAAVAIAAQHEQQHAVRHVEVGGKLLRRGRAQSVEGFRVPTDRTFRGACLDEFLLLRRIDRGFLLGAFVFDDPFRRLRNNITLIVVARATGTTRDLPEIAHTEDSGLLAPVLPELGEEDGADRDVDANAERVGATDQLEQALLCQLLDEDAVLRQQAGVVHADAVTQPTLHVLAERAVEFHPLEFRPEFSFLLLGTDCQAHQRLGGLGRGALGEVHEVNGRTIGGEELGHAFGQRRLRPLERERHRAAVAAHGQGRRTGQAREVLLEQIHRAQRGRHQQETGLGQREQGSLPGIAALVVGVVMKFIHHDGSDVGVITAGECNVGEDLGGTAQHERLGIHGGVAGHHADVLRAEIAAEAEEFLVHQRLDRAGIDRTLSGAECLKVQRSGHERFAGAGGRIEDDIATGEQLEDSLLLFRIEGQPARRHRPEEGVEHRIVIG